MGATQLRLHPMYDLTPAQFWPFIFAFISGIGGMLFGQHAEDSRPYSLVSAILYAIAVACLLLGVVGWVLQK